LGRGRPLFWPPRYLTLTTILMHTLTPDVLTRRNAAPRSAPDYGRSSTVPTDY